MISCSRSIYIRTDIFFDLKLAIKMGNASIAFGTTDRTIDKMLDLSGFGGIGDRLTLLNLHCHTIAEILDRKDAINSLQSAIE